MLKPFDADRFARTMRRVLARREEPAQSARGSAVTAGDSAAGRLQAGRRQGFLRVHRSVILNRAHIPEMQPWFKGDYVLIMRSGARIVSGQTYRDAVRRLIGA